MTQEKYTLPDSSTGSSQTPSQYKSNIDNALEMHEAGAGKHFQAYQQTTPDMTVRIGAGVIYDHSNSTITSVSAQSTSTITAPSTKPRRDLVSIHQSTGALTVTTGTETSTPINPSLPTANFPICYVDLATTTTSITNALITDARVPFTIGGGSSGLSDVVDDTTPQLGGNLDINGKKFNDTNGNELVEFGATTSAVNHIKITNAATGSGSTIEAAGGDTNIDLNIKGKGSGSVNLGAASLKFPNSDGSANQVIKTDGSGNLSFTTQSVGITANAYVRFSTGSSPSIVKSSNVASVTLSTNKYVITFTSAVASANYLVTTGYNGSTTVEYFVQTTNETTTGLEVYIQKEGGSPTGSAVGDISILVFGA